MSRSKTWQCKHLDDWLCLVLVEGWWKNRKVRTLFRSPVHSIGAWYRGVPEKVVYAKLWRLEKRGFLEYGSSPTFPTLTRAGYERMDPKEDQ